MPKKGFDPRFGFLNPFSKPSTRHGLTREQSDTIDPISSIFKNMIDGTFKHSAIKSLGTFRGFIVEVIPKEDNTFFSAMRELLDGNLQQVRVRIPELHASYPDPLALKLGSPERSGATYMHPLFTVSPSLGVLDPESHLGKYVEVDFLDKANFREGRVVSLLEASALLNQQTIDSQAPFNADGTPKLQAAQSEVGTVPVGPLNGASLPPDEAFINGTIYGKINTAVLFENPPLYMMQMGLLPPPQGSSENPKSGGRRILQAALRTPPDFVKKYARSYSNLIGLDMNRTTQFAAWRFNEPDDKRLAPNAVFPGGRYHTGEDVYFPAGTKIYAPFNGKVKREAYSLGGTDGLAIDIVSTEKPDLYLRFLHIGNVSNLIKKNAPITEGQQLAEVFNLGTDSPHLHLECVYGKGFVQLTRENIPSKPAGNVNPFTAIDVSKIFLKG